MTQQGSHGQLDHAARAEAFNRDPSRVDWHDETLWFVRSKRDRAAKQLPEWEALREAASTIKHNVLDNLHDEIVTWDKTKYTYLERQDPRSASGWVSLQ